LIERRGILDNNEPWHFPGMDFHKRLPFTMRAPPHCRILGTSELLFLPAFRRIAPRSLTRSYKPTPPSRLLSLP
jgi:hypothetical protein